MEPTYTFTADRATSYEIVRALMRHADFLRADRQPQQAKELDTVAGVILMAHLDAHGELGAE